MTGIVLPGRRIDIGRMTPLCRRCLYNGIIGSLRREAIEKGNLIVAHGISVFFFL